MKKQFSDENSSDSKISREAFDWKWSGWQMEYRDKAWEEMREYDAKPKYSPLVERVWDRLDGRPLSEQKEHPIGEKHKFVAKDDFAKALEGVVAVPEEATLRLVDVARRHRHVSDRYLVQRLLDDMRGIYGSDHLRKEGK